MPSFEEKLEAVRQQLHDLSTDASASDNDRQKLLSVVESARKQIQPPDVYLWELMFKPQEFGALRIAIDLNLPSILHEHGQATAAELAAKSKADAMLIIRIMRLLCVYGIFQEMGPSTYASTPISTLLAENDKLRNSSKFMWDVVARTAIRFPDYLTSIGHKNPVIKPDNFEFTFGAGSDLFSWLAANPSSLRDFQEMMSIWNISQPHCYEIYPLAEALRGFDPLTSPLLLVDVGGGHGHDLQRACEYFRKSSLLDTLPPGTKLMLQDLPRVIGSLPSSLAASPVPIEAVTHDFFSPQPPSFCNAKIYFIRHIFQDWDDDFSTTILTHIRDAMKPGYSRLLINEWVLPETNADLMPSWLDFAMGAILKSFERSEQQFRDLFDRVGGLKIEKIWGTKEVERVIEVSREK